jgi:DNA mismatch endonuclease (patch repair protein)
VFVDGCFWHSCPEHGRKTPWTGPNAELWEEKMRRNAERDMRASSLAEAKGFSVVRIWECEIARDPHQLASKILGWHERTTNSAKSEGGAVD